MRRSLHLTPELLRAYSRRGNFHSDPDAASTLGYEHLVAQGMQVAGPAYGLLLDAWAEGFLEHGEIELKFVGIVTDGQTVDAAVALEGNTASITVLNASAGGTTAIVGRALRRSNEPA